MEIRLFGLLEVAVDGRTLPVAGQSERSLLAVLACAAGRVVAVDRLIDDLWGEHLPANPANALQVRVSKLRRQLGGRIRTHPAGYALEVDSDDVDVVRFARLVSGRRFEEALAGTYGLFFDFSHQGTVRTAAFTVEVADGQGGTPTTAGHGDGH